MALTYRTTGAWGTGKGSALSQVQLDTNLYTLASEETMVQTGARIGATAGWSVAFGTDQAGLAKLPASQTDSTLVVPLLIPVGATMTGYAIRASLESGGNAATLSAVLRKITLFPAIVDSAVSAGNLTYTVTETSLGPSPVTGLSVTATSYETYYLLITGTTGAGCAINLWGVDVVAKR